ncbi:MAG: DNA primase [Clostridia bacterium]|nr:DNA primase [Clostridia bacterium]MDE6758066.1 DNA primase [Clostridia bacterium]
MAEVFSEWLEKLKSKIDIAEVISPYVSLQERGSKKWACCPFHHEKTPSFCLYEQSQSYHCFGCGVGGDAISFVQEIEHTDFMGAVKILADKYHVPVPDFSKNDGNSNLRKHKDKLFEMMRDTASYFHQNLISEAGKPAREYLAKRGLSMQTATIFGLGYSIGRTQLVAYLSAKGYSKENMQEAGLVDTTQSGNAVDTMAGRLIVPIINNLKQVVAFGGRVLDDSLPKYKNTRETVLFNKSKEIFGQHSVKRLKLETAVNELIVVEGYMDVISLFQSGVKNAIASMGTSLTQEQAKLIRRYVNKVVICYDGDGAGQKATMRGLDILYNQGLEVRVVSLPEKLDPDEYVRKYGKENYLKLLVDAKPLFEHKLNTLASGYDLSSPQEKGKYAVEAMKIIKPLEDPAMIEAYIEYVAKKTGLSKDTLRRQLDVSESAGAIAPPEQVKLGASAFDRAVRYALYGLFGGVEDVSCDIDLSQYIVDAKQRALYDIYRAKKDSGNNTMEEFISHEEENAEVRAVLDEGSKIGDDIAKKYFDDCINKIIKEGNKKRKRALTHAIDSENDEEARFIMMSQLAQNNMKK